MSLMPCFYHADQGFLEGLVLARLFTGYGELELTMCQCVMAIEGNALDGPIRAIFTKRGAETRIKDCRKLLLPEFTKASLDGLLRETLDDLDWCREIRNQYAHCSWYWDKTDKLCFVNLEELAKQPAPIADLIVNRRRLDTKLLTEQEAFFFYVKEMFTHLASAYLGYRVRLTAPRRPIHTYAKPSKVARPPLHN